MGTDLAPGLTSLRADASKGGREKREQEGNVAQKMLIFNSGNHLFFFFFSLCASPCSASPPASACSVRTFPRSSQKEGKAEVTSGDERKSLISVKVHIFATFASRCFR